MNRLSQRISDGYSSFLTVEVFSGGLSRPHELRIIGPHANSPAGARRCGVYMFEPAVINIGDAARAVALCDRLLELLAAEAGMLDVRPSHGPVRFDPGDLRVVLWTAGGWAKEMIVWAPMPMLRDAKEKVLAVRWSLFDFEVLYFQRGTWEGDLFSLWGLRP